MDIQAWLATIPPLAIYTLVTAVILIEMLGVPLPGEIILVSAALLASQGHVDPLWVGICATVGACVGDSLGYLIGLRGGRPLFQWLGRRFPGHFSPRNVALAERAFERWGAWAVFFGRFVALLRIFAGPLAGVLRMPYWKFAAADIPGGVLWAGGTTAVIYYAGVVAEAWLHRFSWIGLLAAVLFGAASVLWIKRRARRAGASDPEADAGPEESAAAPAGRTPVAVPD
ncbi:DedA family protein [Streptomyces aidingensis]|uniref:Membrane protein DedA, SNARE-associated domain n=1 Tax=Streptomyces aidingensis TaxID=910347 RepID=A0A1I1PHD0_9ACTN|nr:DedA family protein [Streptomyces aidingensis]SFD09211.1 membrane protein DedA, SNARE-associated domain [Streptomyces aidingensis]